MSRVSPWTNDFGTANAINDLDDELAAERAARRREASRFVSEQAKVQHQLEQVGSRIDSVTDQISTVLEWTELRFQLLEFDEYQARKEIRKAFRALAQGRPAVLPEVDDVPGYWMPPAALAVLPLILRERHPAAVPACRPGANPFEDLKSGLESARERDAVRAQLFHLAVGLCFDQPAFIDATVLRLLSEPVGLGQTEAGQVAKGWRALWEHVALGGFGPAAVEQLSGRLAALFDPPPSARMSSRSGTGRSRRSVPTTTHRRRPRHSQHCAPTSRSNPITPKPSRRRTTCIGAPTSRSSSRSPAPPSDRWCGPWRTCTCLQGGAALGSELGRGRRDGRGACPR